MSKSILHMKIDADLKEKLRKQAEKDNRNLTNFIETILLKAVQTGK